MIKNKHYYSLFNLFLGDVSALHGAIIHLIEEQRIGHLGHLLHRVVWHEAAQQQQHPEAD